MKKWTWVLIIAFFVSLLIIIISRNDEDNYLGDNYFFLPAYEAVDIGFPHGAIIYRASEENIFNDIVLKDVSSVDNDDDFILVSQEGVDFSFFIIHKKSDSLYGPYDRVAFSKKRIEMQVSDHLTLDRP